MARDITALGSLYTRTLTRAGAITGSEDQFSLPTRNVLRATDWYTFTLSHVATSITIRSTPRPQSHDMVGWLYGGTITPTSDIADLGSPLEYNDDGGVNLNFQISRSNLAVGDYTIAAQRHTVHNADYGLDVVAVVPGAPTPPGRPVRPIVSAASPTTLSVSWVAPSDGGSALIDYDVRYKKSVDSVWSTWLFSGIGLVTTIKGLTAATRYDVQVRARNIVGLGGWSASRLGATLKLPASAAVVTLEIDWGNDGTFSHAAADVTGDLVKHSLRTTRGRTLQSRRKAVAGRLEAKLWNINAKYDPVNSSSPVFERDIAGLRVRAKLAGVVIWAGRIDSQRYRHRPVPQLDIIALGLLSTLRQPVSVATQSSESVGAVAKLVGAAAGVATTHLAGDKTLDRWPGVSDQDALGVLHDLEEYEEGFLKEQADGELVLETETARLTGDSAVSALTLTDQILVALDVPILKGSALDWGFRQIANVVNVPVTPLATGAAGVITLWHSSAIRINAGIVLDFRIGYPADRGSPLSHVGVESWIDPVAGIDYTAQNGLLVSGMADGDLYVVTFENRLIHGGPAGMNQIAVGPFTLRGTPLVAGSASFVQTKDTASIAAFGEREYARPSPLFTDVGKAQEYADGIVSHRKTPQGWLIARWPAEAAVLKARLLDLSRRVTVTRLGKTGDYYIESIGLSLRGFVQMEYLLSPIPGATVPSAPNATLAAVIGDGTKLAVSWPAPYNGGSVITDYDVRYKLASASTWTMWPHAGTGRTATITGLALGTAYDVQLRATNAQGSSVWSVPRVGATLEPPATPAAPAVDGGVGSLRVSWTEPPNGGDPITGYAVRYKETSASAWASWPHTGTSPTATITGLSTGTIYDVQVRATNRVGASGWSGSGSVSTAAVANISESRRRTSGSSGRSGSLAEARSNAVAAAEGAFQVALAAYTNVISSTGPVTTVVDHASRRVAATSSVSRPSRVGTGTSRAAAVANAKASLPSSFGDGVNVGDIVSSVSVSNGVWTVRVTRTFLFTSPAYSVYSATATSTGTVTYTP